MARTQGIDAQRINLYGRHSHTVAEADLGKEGAYVVDCQNPPGVVDLERLDDIVRRPEYGDYSTINLRRTGLSWIVTRVKLRLGPLTYWTENPHALKAGWWFGLAISLWTLWGVRRAIRRALRARGWVHVTDRMAVEKAVAAIGHATALHPATADVPPGQQRPPLPSTSVWVGVAM